MLSRLLLVMGEELVLSVRQLPGPADHDLVAHAHNAAALPSDRVADALAWMEMSIG
jgi:hypothetical protein